MTRTIFMAGISALALTAGSAAAQTSDTTDANGNRAAVDCVPNNTCIVDNQVNTSIRNSATLNAPNGTGNYHYVTQRGDRLIASSRSDGINNVGLIYQQGNTNTAAISGTGIAQGNFASNYGIIDQRADNNSATITMTQTLNVGSTPAANTNQAYVYQGRVAGDVRNQFSVTQNGSNLRINGTQQGANFLDYITASDNSARVVQTGAGSDVSIGQSRRGNSATVTIGGGGLNSGSSRPGNTAILTQVNDTIVRNADGAYTYNVFGVGSAANDLATNNRADLAIVGLQNLSNVYQSGVNNSATVSILGGGSGNTNQGGTAAAGLPADRVEGNWAVIDQLGVGNSAEVSAGGRTSTNPNGGRGNLATIRQGDRSGLYLAFNGPRDGRDMRALVYQRGTGDTVTIDQNNNTSGPAGALQSASYADVTQLSYGSSTTIMQFGTNRAEVAQGLNADNSGGQLTLMVYQTDAGDTATNPNPGSDPFGGSGTASPVARANLVQASQSGLLNSGTITQNTILGRATLFQTRGSRDNIATIDQGAGTGNNNGSTGGIGGAASAGTTNDSFNLQADVRQDGRGGTVTIGQDGANNTVRAAQAGVGGTASAPAASGNQLTVRQGARFQFADVGQNGYGLTAAVQQAGGAGTAALPNRATVSQAGYSQTATIVQQTTAGASIAGSTSPQAGIPNNSAFPNARTAGTAYSAEATIVQTMNGNSATINQAGRGQYARIEQTGTGNTGRIIQGAAATNAVAILEQSGNSNSLQLQQTMAGQYIRVQQAGNGNAALTTTEFSGSGANGGTVTVPAP